MGSEQVNQGIELVRAGRLEEAGRILARVVQEDPQNDTAWAWLSACFEQKERKLYCLDRAIRINPQNLIALGELANLSSKPPAGEVPAEQVEPPAEPPYSPVPQDSPDVGRPDSLPLPEWSAGVSRRTGRRLRRNRRRLRLRIPIWLVLGLVAVTAVVLGVAVLAGRVFVPLSEAPRGTFQERTALFMQEAEILMTYSDGSSNFSAFRAQKENTAAAYVKLQADWPPELAYQKDEMDQAMKGWTMTIDIADQMKNSGECVLEGDLLNAVMEYTREGTTDRSCSDWAAVVLSVASRHYFQARPGLESYSGK